MNQLLRGKNEALRKNKKKGFTLVELIIVIAIIAILAAMAIPKFSSVRMDSKVSNDVAAAKNIATQVATLLANENAAIPTDSSDIDVSATSEITDRLDGRASTGVAEALVGEEFIVNVDTNENITVLVDGNELYPDNDGAGKVAYVTAVEGQ